MTKSHRTENRGVEHPATVFLSYSTSDRVIATAVVNDLVKHEHEVWIDWGNIEPSTDWWIEISDAILRSDVFVLLLSTSYLSSEVSGSCARRIARCWSMSANGPSRPTFRDKRTSEAADSRTATACPRTE